MEPSAPREESQPAQQPGQQPAERSAQPQVHEIGNRTYHVASEVKPLDVTGVRTVMVGTALFLVAGLALLPFHDWLAEHDRVWWLYTCAAGFGLGMFGFDYTRRRARHLGEKLPLEDKLRRGR